MDLVDAQQRRIADPVADAGIAHLGPEGFVAGGVGGAEPDVAEAGDPGVPFAVIAPAAVGGPPHQLDLVAGRILEGDEAPHLAQIGFLRRTQADMMAEPIKLRGCRLQIRALGHFERGGLIGRRTGEVAQRVLALVGLEIHRVLRMVRDFEAEIIRGEPGGAVEIARCRDGRRRRLAA